LTTRERGKRPITEENSTMKPGQPSTPGRASTYLIWDAD
jgi:hypothetical protein